MSAAPQTKRQQKTRLAFINAFLRLINTRALDQITVSDIADEANYGRWAFYQYFQNKEDVVYAAFVHWMRQLDTYIVASVQHLESPRREYESWRIIFRTFHQQQVIFARLATFNDTSGYRQVKEFLIEQFSQHLLDGRFALMPGVRSPIAARLYVVALLELLEYWNSSDGSEDVDALADEFFIFMFKQPPPKAPL